MIRLFVACPTFGYSMSAKKEKKEENKSLTQNADMHACVCLIIDIDSFAWQTTIQLIYF
jgi:hypothetical protein